LSTEQPGSPPTGSADLTLGNALTFERADGSTYLLWVSPPPVVAAILDLAGLAPGDVLYDLGSADGRVIIRAAREHDVRAVGIERNPDLCEYSRRRIREAGLEDRVTVKTLDFNAEDLGPADVIVFFLGVEDLGASLAERLKERVQAGARLVTVDCPIGDLQALAKSEVRFESSQYTVYLYRRTGESRDLYVAKG
jgi:protein-L-isoaspartate O-methyltransferase